MNSPLPSGWELSPLSELARVYSGGTPSRNVPAYWGGAIPWVTTAEIDSGYITSTRETITDAGLRASAARIAPPGTLLLAMYGQGKTRGKSALLGIAAAMNQACAAIEVSSKVDPRYLLYYLSWQYDAIRSMSNAGSQDNLSGQIVRKIQIVLPTMPEQYVVAGALDDASNQIKLLERLIAKKQAVKQGMMQQLLTGKMRLSGFSGQWQSRKLEDLLAPRVERYTANEPLEVLSCTKNQGFVRSLDYFKNQVFSRNLSGYRVIRRGDIGYPANHIEEGSIGVQETYEAALVSPIYVVMRPIGGVDTYFIQRQLKLDYFRQEFARVTNASVNRRGSLRWSQFSQIEVRIPDYDEQRAISRCLRDSEKELNALRCRLEKARAVKQGMMQQLLTGRTRLPVQETAA